MHVCGRGRGCARFTYSRLVCLHSCLFIPANTLDAVTVVLFNLLSVFADKQALAEDITGVDVSMCTHSSEKTHKYNS